LDTITDELEREATVGIIHNCELTIQMTSFSAYTRIVGQTPRKLFNAPHPQRFAQGPSTLPLGTLHGIEENYDLLTQGKRPAARGNCPITG
jgi:hypothetical protein